MSRSVIAVIPARGGSTRIKNKNIAPFCGLPMIAWTIRAAQRTGLFERIVVSTDNEAIAEVSRAFGADVPFLREKHADAHSPVSEATIHALEQLEAKLGIRCDDVVQLFACCPLRDEQVIQGAYERFLREDADFLISASSPPGFNPWWAAKLDASSRPTRLFPEAYRIRSQDLEPLYIPSGAVWIARSERLREEGSFYGPGHLYYPIDWKAALDIDEEADLRFAEAIARAEGLAEAGDGEIGLRA